MINSQRQVFDGFVFFGTKKKSEPDPKTGDTQILNDFVIKTTDLSQQRPRGR